MKDLSQGSIPGHVASMSMQMFVGMAVQVAYFVTDLKFVALQGGNNVAAGFSIAGNLWFFVLALTQLLNVGTAALVSHAVGAKQHERANLVFNQSLVMSMFLGVFVLVLLFSVARPYMHMEAADAVVAQGGIDYLMGVTPGLAMQFLMISLFATLRGTGIVTGPMIIQLITVGLNILLAAILTIGWLPGSRRPLPPSSASSSVRTTSTSTRNMCRSIATRCDPTRKSGSGCCSSACRSAWSSPSCRW
jgi:Na+-driven multidrug efflux pump